MLKNTNVVLGVTGGIAAYKACDIVSRLKKLQANVDVIMTKSATEMVQPHTFQALSQNPVITDTFSTPRYWDIEHISLAQKADILLVAPATANIIGKVANGISDDMLSTTIMASTAKVIFAPAMNTKMYENRIVQQNIEKLTSLGYQFIEPASGRLACGDIGRGKLADVDEIIEFVINIAKPNRDLEGKKVLITAGPTRESLDPVRFITNHSSGKMGYSLAEAAVERGADVTLISGPTNLCPPKGVRLIKINTTLDMYNAVMKNYIDQHIIIKSAAVADYRPETVSTSKIKKNEGNLTLTLVRNPDILKELGCLKEDRVLVGFAAESDNVIENAKGKINRKNLDFIVANDITEEGAGFGTDTNIVNIIDKNGEIEKVEKSSKREIAHRILDKAKKFIK
ncbi:bifunctional phosphopantothenoylcysteine decarboxylase/phosphopantothenate--cysteine ligase CoaBC [Alkaliphilus sp. B6464]|uniref:bifunctional phosphopantothenoylcysteine decarboxylase/phosphopantothenate--cysteine ligase CoaBC n=1 Tax=Alkaliphilus sp. B6464 TaxID=2731219 RepID=UPI001BA75D58|nr:bifunctional phosphopantothenoylcysteine decarboxylase/phosphopantothenate--cysteine ligase CoaBC [Alkaliphilus sp. B6464]QUH20894.1 bifunctional phosphopantothenoylcysteine decarboxylase/phosphopantothenate--cysteine ligase CoaBC [Alkaliphilus sp. B6464]